MVAFGLADIRNLPVGDTMAVGTAFGALLGGAVEWATRRRLPEADADTADWPRLRGRLRDLTRREWVVGERAPLAAVSANSLRLIDQPWSKNGRKAGTMTPAALAAIDAHRTFVRSASGVAQALTFACRGETYAGLRPLLVNVDTEVRLMPMTPRQIDALLAESAPACPGLPEAVRDRPELRHLLSRPLWWPVMTSVFRAGGAVEASVTLAGGPGPAGADEQVMLRAGLERTLSATGDEYDAEDSRRYLTFLARMLSDRGDAVLYPHEVQPGWLPPGAARRAAHVVAGAMLWIATVLTGTGALSLLRVPGWRPSVTVLAAWAVLCAAAAVAFVRSPAFAPKEQHRLSWRVARRRLPATCLYAVGAAVVAGCAFIYARGPGAGLIIYSLSGAFCRGDCDHFSNTPHDPVCCILPVRDADSCTALSRMPFLRTGSPFPPR
ncbi:hypothetical protein JIG36_30465 [Actinoplanes sp. LDG1-06]|uniref:Uncharacterized protein n=1 Tax=Paractinoplanes ovalisporus TaxID=2810368 RepID=A0ABS2AJ10_9ACTN|nr:hypothetical protein [Actinoplanes ovalisporus]MBM2619843.1 hypothetical protein [Actinoplanes ovalisporus]